MNCTMFYNHSRIYGSFASDAQSREVSPKSKRQKKIKSPKKYLTKCEETPRKIAKVSRNDKNEKVVCWFSLAFPTFRRFFLAFCWICKEEPKLFIEVPQVVKKINKKAGSREYCLLAGSKKQNPMIVKPTVGCRKGARLRREGLGAEFTAKALGFTAVKLLDLVKSSSLFVIQ